MTGRRVDERIEGLSSKIEALARQDKGCERLMTVPALGRSSRVRGGRDRHWRYVLEKTATSARGLGWYRDKSPPETEQFSPEYQNEAIANLRP